MCCGCFVRAARRHSGNVRALEGGADGSYATSRGGMALAALGGVMRRSGVVAFAVLGGFLAGGAAHADDTKLESHLRALLEGTPRAVRLPDTLARAESLERRADRVQVRVRLAPLETGAVSLLAAAGLSVERDASDLGLVEGWIRPSDLHVLAALDAVRSVAPVRRGVLRVSEGDSASRADVARNTSGFTGVGVKVGVISDGVDGYAPDPVPGGFGCAAGGGAEGVAMLHIVHDLAPGATLAFSEGLSSPLAFINSLTCLRNADATVIVDDVGFFDEPFFEDGPVATAVRNAVAAGVSYHTAAGNEALFHWLGGYHAAPVSMLHAFDGLADTNEDVTVPSFSRVDCVLQWNDRFGQSSNDYNLAIYDQGNALVDQGNTVQNGASDPIEFASVENPGGTSEVVHVRISRASGINRVLRLFCLGAAGMKYVTPDGSIFGHPGIAEAVTVTAIDVHDPGLNDVESYGSRGPVTVYYPVQETRSKPDIAGFDGVTTPTPGFAPFFGTSAAAAHVAAVAALLRSKNACATPAQIQTTLKNAAVDIEAVGFDTIAGAGRLDAKNAIDALVQTNCLVDADCNDGSVCTTDSCVGCVCVHAPVSCDDHNPCTADSCDPALGCQHADLPDGTSCADATVCNGAETCASAVCVPGTPLTCTDGDPCTQDLCDPVNGCVFPPDPCDDGEPCTTDSCDSQLGCQHAPAPDGTPCANADPCDGDETCQTGVCQPGTPLMCDDGDACTTDSCTPGQGCVAEPLRGFEGLDCVCQQDLALPACAAQVVPQAVRGRFERACRLIQKAQRAAARHPRALVRRAANLLGGAAVKAERAVGRSRLDGGCGGALSAACWDANLRANGIADGL